MMYGYGMGLWGMVMMLIPLAIMGFIVYWAVYAGVKNGMKEKNQNQ